MSDSSLTDWTLFGSEDISPIRSVYDKFYSIELLNNPKKQKTDKYDSRIVVVRRGGEFQIKHRFFNDQNISSKNVNIRIYKFLHKRAYINLNSESGIIKGFNLYLEEETKDFMSFRISIDHTCAIGLYSIEYQFLNTLIYLKNSLYIVYNPFNKHDPVYVSDPKLIEEHLLKTNIKIYAGSAKHHSPIRYLLDQHSIESIFICSYFLAKIPNKKRSNPIEVSREFSAFVNGNDENGLVLGKWYDIEGGTAPTEWTRALEIYITYLKTSKSVKWGQCFVFAMMLTSMCRNVGIVCRAISGFDIGHDNDLNGVIEILLDEKTLESVSGSETLWNYHAWNNIILSRNDINTGKFNVSISADGWQHLDGTPQERSKGIYRCGPFPIEFIRRGIYNPSIPFDGQSIFYSINYTTKLTMLGSNKEVLSEKFNKKSTFLILTTNSDGHKEDIIDEYKPVTREEVLPESKKVLINLEVPEAAIYGEEMEFNIDVSNSSQLSLKRLTLTVDLVNINGSPILKSHVFSNAYKFEDSDFKMASKINYFEIKSIIDLSLSSFAWNLTYIDKENNILKYVIKKTEVKPCIEGSFIESVGKIGLGVIKIKLKVKNLLNIKFPLSIEFYSVKFIREDFVQISNFRGSSEKIISANILIKKYGYHKIYAKVFSRYYNGIIDKIKFIAQR